MRLKKVLNRSSVRVGLPGSTKDEIIREMVGIILADDRDFIKEDILNAVFQREAQMSTGMKNGIAIPHGKVDCVTRLHAAVAVSAEPVDFDCLDGLPAQIFVMTVSPTNQTGPHLQFLAEVSALLADDDFRRRILAAKNEDELLKAFCEGRADA
ncbi:PTS system, IIA component [Olavius algarvensis spirochete endosymbiont]|uniref:PTS sugar transporter subunit IIA n=1 Tax=Olavius algarvensis spirochete endosymbiont TaxID=260710 RepID=UPI000F11FBC7|nr:PTS sugar transporter subunit IIA [Olavius algarvensis spirochete endosymbiont]CAD7837758.1 MAG: PTS system, IIA component [Olavius algarvensis spirochete endosymbiont]VDB00280.1 PTS system, IIA component [Olavius algarvensis spirochete endosymbiont]